MVLSIVVAKMGALIYLAAGVAVLTGTLEFCSNFLKIN
jgi:hypothetical protein